MIGRALLCLILCACLAPLSSVPAAASLQPTPQEKVVDDDSELPRNPRQRNLPDIPYHESAGGGNGSSRRKIELVLGVAAVIAFLIYGLFRWQARTSRGR